MTKQIIHKDDYRSSLDRATQDRTVDGCSRMFDVVAEAKVLILLNREVVFLSSGESCGGYMLPS